MLRNGGSDQAATVRGEVTRDSAFVGVRVRMDGLVEHIVAIFRCAIEMRDIARFRWPQAQMCVRDFGQV